LAFVQILAVRRTAAARQGLLVDLTTEAPEDELAAAQAELEAKEREEDAAQRAAALANKRKALEEAVVSQGYFVFMQRLHTVDMRAVPAFLWFLVVCMQCQRLYGCEVYVCFYGL
jgi:hypothetical protein